MQVLSSASNFIYWYGRPVIGGIVITGILLYLLIKKRFPSTRILSISFFTFIGLIIIRSIFLSFAHWYLWAHNEFTKTFLTPNLGYYFQKIWYYCWMEPLINLGFAILAIIFVYRLNKFYANNFFYDEEKWLVGLAILSNGWPLSLLAICFSIAVGLLLHVGRLVVFSIKKLYQPGYRLSFLYIWMPIALLVLAFGVIMIIFKINWFYIPIKDFIV